MIGVVKVWAATALIEAVAAARAGWRFVTRRHFTGTDVLEVCDPCEGTGIVAECWDDPCPRGCIPATGTAPKASNR